MANGHGGKREGAGRKPGAVSEAKKEIASEAKKHASEALATLVSVMTDAEAPHAARVSAANAVLDRGYGKPIQAVHGAGDQGEHIIRAYGWLPPQE